MQRGKNFYLFSIWSKINAGKTQAEIQKELNFNSRQQLKYYRDSLVKLGYIEKTGVYGEWKISKKFDEKEVKIFLKEVKKSTRVGKVQLEEVKKNKEIRGHAFLIKLLLPNDYKNWKNRRKIFDLINLEWKPHFIGENERGEIATMDGIQIHFYNKTIVFNFDEKDFIEDTAKQSKNKAIFTWLKLVKKLERIFNNSPLSHYGKYKFQVIRQHYAIMKNALAKQYIKEKKKLEVYTGKGLWLLIDNSFKLEELETVHPNTAEEDNEKVHEHFNQIKATDIETIKEMTPGAIKEALIQSASQIKANAKNLDYHSENMRSHVGATKDLSKATKLLNQNILKQNKLFERIAEALEKK